MKTPEEVLAAVQRRLNTTWTNCIAGDASDWPYSFPIGEVEQAELESRWEHFHTRARAWRDWAADRPVQLDTKRRKVYTTLQTIPSHMTITTIDHAATIVGAPWPERIARGRRRYGQLTTQFPTTDSATAVVSATDSYTDTDFGLLLTAAAWFRDNTAEGLTPRQVPVPGLHAKWLNTHQRHILAITGHDTLGLLPPHPPRAHLTYLDPHYLVSGARRHDCATVGDAFVPAYTPRIVMISENKDTAIHFPDLAGAIAVEGDGFGGRAAAGLSWLTGAEHLLYWGDIDAAGYEILNNWRADGVAATSILMDAATYEAFEMFGTNTDRKNRPLKPGEPRELPHLSAAEAGMYRLLLDFNHRGHRRVEQERIPLATAAAAVAAAVTAAKP